MDTKNVLLSFALVLVLSVAGCIGGGTAVGGDGLSVSFSTNTPTVDGDGTEKVEFTYRVKNVGDALARSTQVSVFNYATGLSTTTGSANFGNIEPALTINDVTRGAEEQHYSFVFETGERMLGIDDNVDVGARLTYEYDSWGSTETSLLPEEEWREGIRLQRVAGETYVSKGPVRVTVSTLNPIVISNVSDGFMVYVDLDNVGSGRVRHATYDYDYIDSVDLNLPVGYNVTDYCDFTGTVDISTESTVTLTHGGSAEQRLRLVDGENRRLLCRVVANETVIPQAAQFSAVAMYRYQQDTFATVRILGTATD